MALGYRPASPGGALLTIALVTFCAFALSWVFALIGVTMSSPGAVQAFSTLADGHGAGSVLAAVTGSAVVMLVVAPLAVRAYLRRE